MDLLWEETQETIKANQMQINEFDECIEKNKNNENNVQYLKEQKQLFLEEREHLINSNIDYQKKLYRETGDIDYSRNIITLPLNKNVAPNMILENFWVEFLFYDNIGVNNGVYEEYKKLKDESERKEFIKKNIEVTHISLKTKNAFIIKHFIPNATTENLLHDTLIISLVGNLKEELPNNLIKADINDLIKILVQ